MKRGDFLSILFAAFAMVAAITVTAQPQGGGQRQGGQQGTPEEMAKMMVERMAEQLSLTEEQQTKIYDINLEFIESRNSDSNERPSREEMEAARKGMTTKIKAVLTDEQATKYAEIEAKMSERGPRQQQQ
ncbi:MAG: DUF4890 domain-containing protein [Rikenellaceae bacterium]